MINQVRTPQCLVPEGFVVSGSSFSGGISAVVGQAYFVPHSSRKIPSLNDRKRTCPIFKHKYQQKASQGATRGGVYIYGLVTSKIDDGGLSLILVYLSMQFESDTVDVSLSCTGQ